MAGRKAKTGGKARGGPAKAKAHSPDHAADLEARRKAKAAEREAKKAGWSQERAKAEAEMKAADRRRVKQEAAAKGRPTIYTRELADAILESIAHEGMTAREACKTHGIVYATFSSWIADNRDGLCERWMRIKRLRVFEMLDEAIRIADDASGDLVETEEGFALNRENIQRSKLRVEVRQWTMQRLLREHFGDKVAITGGGPEDAPVKFAPDLASMSDDDLKALARLHSAMAGAT